MQDEFFATAKPSNEKVYNKEDILKMWPQAAGELRGFKKALERNSGITAAQLGMALQLAEVEFQRLCGVPDGNPRAYKPAINRHTIQPGNDECPLAVLRSHPEFPETLSPELEGVVVATNPAWPEETIKLVLRNFEPPCHTDWRDFNQERTEEHNGQKAFVVYVRPGPESAAAKR